MMDWINHPALKDMAPEKRELFQVAAEQVAGKSGSSMATVMMSLITGASKKGIRFTPEEISLILELIKEGKTPAEQQSIDKTVGLVKKMMKKKE